MFRLLFVLWCGCFAAAASAAPIVLVMGDSLSAGYGLDAGQGWVSLLDQKIRTQGLPWTVVNASVSGETTSGGLARLPAVLDRHHPQIVLLELGGNDGLRGLPPKAMRANLEKMVELTRAAGGTPVLFQMRIPANYGPGFTTQFADTFDEVAREKNAPIVPFLLATIGLDPGKWFQEDGIHPNAMAQPKLLDEIWPTVEPLLSKKPEPKATK